MRAEAERLLHNVLGPQARFRDGQWEAIAALVERRERVLVVQRTGWGKSLVYFIATRLLRDRGAGPTILISPLLALMRNQVQAAERLGLRADTINSARALEDNEAVVGRLLDGETDLLLISPERLANERFRGEVWPHIRGRIGMLVVDEAHCISDWGHDFRPNYRRIVGLLKEIPPEAPVLGTTATANDRVVRDVSEILGAGLNVMRGPLARESLSLFVAPRPLSTAERLVWTEYLLRRISGSGIVYCATTDDCRRVAGWLVERGLPVRPYYSQVEDDTGDNREVLENQLLNNEVKALVASVALGMGFDKPDLSFVIHFQYPGSIIGYYQQIGRAGRALDQAWVVLLHGPGDDDVQQYFIENAFPRPAQVEQAVETLEKHGPLSLGDLQRVVNANNATLDKILVHLEVEGIARRLDSGRYELAGAARAPDYTRWERVTGQRYAELAQMQAYVREPGCLMHYIARALDDVSAGGACGRCANCRRRPLAFQPDPRDVESARIFLHEGEPILIEPKKAWPRGFLPRPSEHERFVNEPGLALCYYHDGGWGELVQKGKYRDGHYAGELVDASVEALRGHWARLKARPKWVTAIPSLRRPDLVPGFAARLAEALGLEFRPVLRQSRERPEQKNMQNRYQQVANLWGTFALDPPLPGPVLLVDDMCDSGWTFAVAGQLLREAGSGPVHPFALARVGLAGAADAPTLPVAPLPADGAPLAAGPKPATSAVSPRAQQVQQTPLSARAPRAYEKWTPEEEARLTQLVEDGRSAREIATELKRLPHAITSRLIRLGLQARPDGNAVGKDEEAPVRHLEYWTREEDARMLELFRAGLSDTKIARELGRGAGAVKMRLAGMRNAALGPEGKRTLGQHPENLRLVDVIASQYGPYIRNGPTRAPLPRQFDPTRLTLEEAVVILRLKGK